MALVVRVFLMKVRNSTDPCVGAAALLKSPKVKPGRFSPHRGNDILFEQSNCSSDSHYYLTVIIILLHVAPKVGSNYIRSFTDKLIFLL